MVIALPLPPQHPNPSHDVLLIAMGNFFAQYIVQYTDTRDIWLAYSGGSDSYALLMLCVALRDRYRLKLHAVHVNHQLHPQAQQWADHCRACCQHYTVDYVEHTIIVLPQDGTSIEQVAREKRYALFAQLLGQGEMLLSAHHQDDQAETVLLQLLRGAGPRGLAAMPSIKPLGCGWHARPLLLFAKHQLTDYAQQATSAWQRPYTQHGYIEDDSNQDVRYSRNFIRQQVLPLLRQRYPSASKTLARSARHCAEQQAVLSELAESLYQQAQGQQPGTLSRQALLSLSAPMQRLVLRTWISQQGCILPSTVRMASIQRQLLQARSACRLCISWGKVSLRLFRNELYLVRVLLVCLLCK